MNYQKGFGTKVVLLIVGVLLVLGGVGYWIITSQKNAPIENTNKKNSIEWRFTNMGETDGMPSTHVAVILNGTTHDMGEFLGSCKELSDGGIDGKGLLAGELSAAQCYFAGGGDEIGVFAHEDGGYDLMVGELGEGDSETPFFRGNFKIRHTIPAAEHGDGTSVGENLILGFSSDGSYLTAYNGMTLYTYSKDSDGKSVCNGQCAINWPPYTVPSASAINIPANITSSNVGTITRSDGALQVTYKGAPLYFYVSDNEPGDTTGDKVGNVWFLVKP